MEHHSDFGKIRFGLIKVILMVGFRQINRWKKIVSKFSELDSEAESKSDTELMAKLKSDSDSE